MAAFNTQEGGKFYCNIFSVLKILTLVILIIGVLITVFYYFNYELPKIAHGMTDVQFHHHHQQHKMQVQTRDTLELPPVNFSDLHCRHPVYDFEKSDIDKLFADYTVFHNKGVQLLLSGMASDVRTLTWNCVRDCGGLGSRFRGFTVNLIFALLTKRVVLFRWDEISPVNMFLVPNMIDWRYQNYSFLDSFIDLGYIRRVHFVEPKKIHVLDNVINELNGPTKHLQMRYNHILKFNKTIFSLVSKANNLDVTKMFNIIKKYHIRDLQTLAVSYLFRFSKELKQFASEIRSNLNLHGKEYVALHLRTGQFDGNLSEHSSRFPKSFGNYKNIVSKAIKAANRKIGHEVVVVLVSDSGSVKKELTKEFSRVKALDNIIVHVDKMKHLDSYAMLGTWQDIIIMAESQLLVRRASSFADISVFLCRIPESRIVEY